MLNEEEIGGNQNIGYIFAQTARRYRLVIISLAKARELSPRMQSQHGKNESLINCLDNQGWPAGTGPATSSAKETK